MTKPEKTTHAPFTKPEKLGAIAIILGVLLVGLLALSAIALVFIVIPYGTIWSYYMSGYHAWIGLFEPQIAVFFASVLFFGGTIAVIGLVAIGLIAGLTEGWDRGI